MLDSFGLPSVTVPVLSSTTVVSVPALCRASPLRIKMPFCAARPTATMTEMGVAKHSADLVDESGDVRLAGLGGANAGDDLRQHGIAADARGFEEEGAGLVEG